MKVLVRAGAFLIIISATLFLAAVQRSTDALYQSWGVNELQPNKWYQSQACYLAPRSIQLSFGTANQTRIDIYIVNAEALSGWNQTIPKEYVITVENASNHRGTYEIPERDWYEVLVYNPNEIPVDMEIDIMLCYYEKDLLTATASMAIVGVALIACQLLPRKVRKLLKT